MDVNICLLFPIAGNCDSKTTLKLNLMDELMTNFTATTNLNVSITLKSHEVTFIVLI